jgi:predicted N-formylglutamate amidohydrolase
MSAPRIIVTCEHASENIPDRCRADLAAYAESQEPHRRVDWGAPEIAGPLAQLLGAPLFLGDICRLAVDLNRSLDNPDLHAPPIRDGASQQRAWLVDTFHKPFRSAVRDRIGETIANSDSVLHLSIHSFTSVFYGVPRAVDLGVLFDPDRPAEAALGDAWTDALRAARPDLRIHPNQPYEGKADGHTTALRSMYPDGNYIGIEIELSQGLPLQADSQAWAALLAQTLRACWGAGAEDAR